jgi:hypothetical protein
MRAIFMDDLQRQVDVETKMKTSHCSYGSV